ncbi:hypothetical protein, partial [Vibrio parahaemolyticus]|uniref:hypothetical protein n=1 Tax=Vibrio parahaemolyticus TaxID=670 RepID=UPI001E39614C
ESLLNALLVAKPKALIWSLLPLCQHCFLRTLKNLNQAQFQSDCQQVNRFLKQKIQTAQETKARFSQTQKTKN